MPTLAELSGATSPKTDGLSLTPTLLEKGEQQNHPYLYWEFVGQTAVRKGQWKAYKSKKDVWELYDLSSDIEELKNVSKENPKILKELIALAKSSHQPIRPGKIFSHNLINKDRLQAPHQRRK